MKMVSITYQQGFKMSSKLIYRASAQTKKTIIKKQKGTLKTLVEKRRELRNEDKKAKKRSTRKAQPRVRLLLNEVFKIEKAINANETVRKKSRVSASITGNILLLLANLNAKRRRNGGNIMSEIFIRNTYFFS